MRRSIPYSLVFSTTIACLLIVGTCTTPVSDKPDTNPPNQITQIFFYQVLPTAVELGWIAPADDRGDSVKLYDCRYSQDSLTSANWENAEPVNNLPTPGHSGAYQRVMLTNLDSLDAYYFAIRSMDKAGNYSSLSKVIKKVALPLDTFAPTPITNVFVVSRDTFSLLLNWSAPNEHIGQAATRYEIRYDTAMITEQNWLGASLAAAPPIPSAPGVVDSFLLTGLQPNTRYYCGIRSADLFGHMSTLSNIASAFTLDTLTSDTLPTDTIPTGGDSIHIITSAEFGSYAHVVPQAVAVDGNGSFVIAGDVRDGGFQNDYYLVKLDDEGRIVWDKRFGDETNEGLNDVTLTTNGLLVAIGGGEGSTESIYWFDQNGNSLKVKPIDSSYGAASNSGIAATPDGGVAILYQSSRSFGMYGAATVARVAKYNVLGEKEWESVLIGGNNCVHWEGDVMLASGFPGEITVVDSLIFVSWMGDQSSGVGIGGCGPPETRSFVTIFGMNGVSRSQALLADMFWYYWYPVGTSFLSVDKQSVSANRFQALLYENDAYRLHSCDLQGNVVTENSVSIGANIEGMLRVYTDGYLVYGAGNTGETSDKLFMSIITGTGGIRQHFSLLTEGKSVAHDALLLPNGTVVLIAESTASDNTTTKGLFLLFRP